MCSWKDLARRMRRSTTVPYPILTHIPGTIPIPTHKYTDNLPGHFEAMSFGTYTVSEGENSPITWTTLGVYASASGGEVYLYINSHIHI